MTLFVDLVDESINSTSADGVPEGWTETELGTFVASMANGVYKPAEAYAADGVACLRMYNIQDGTIVLRDVKRMQLSPAEVEQYRLDRGDILVNRVNSRELVGKAALCPDFSEPTVFESKNIRVRLDATAVVPAYVNLLLLHDPIRQRLTDAAKQTVGMATVSQPTLASLRLPFPPLAEQKRIVAKLEELLGKLEAAKQRLAKVPALLKRFRQSILAAACSGRLTEPSTVSRDRVIGELRDPSEFEWPGRGEMRKSWKWAYLGDIADCRLGKMLDKAKNSGLPTRYLRNINVRWFGFDLTDLFEMRIEPDERETFAVRDGDVLVCEGGEPGRAAVWRGGSNELVFQKAIHRVRLPEFILPEWFVLNVKHDAEAGHLDELFTGSTIKHLTGVQFAKYPMVVPPPREQHEIVRRVEALFTLADAAERRVAAASAKADRITAAILAKAFRGELLPTEATLARREGRDYEPASVLLDRIRIGRPARQPKAGNASTSTKLAGVRELISGM